MSLLVIGGVWLLAILCVSLLGRLLYWHREWEELSLTHARTLDQLENAKAEIARGVMRQPTLAPPCRRKAPRELSLLDQLQWDLREYERLGMWDEHLAWRLHPDDAQAVNAQLFQQQRHEGASYIPTDGLRILGTPIVMDWATPRYDTARSGPRAEVLQLQAAKAAGMVPQGRTGPPGQAAAGLALPGVQTGIGLSPPGPAPRGGGEVGARRDARATVEPPAGGVPLVRPTDELG